MNKMISVPAAAVAVFLCAARVFGGAVDGIAAVVNDGIITYSELEERLAPPARRGEVFFESAGRMELSALIEEKLLSAKADELGVLVSPGDVEEDFEEMRISFPSEEAFRSFLREQRITESGLRGRLKARLLLAEIARIEILPGQPRPSSEEAKRFYDENPGMFYGPGSMRLSRILITAGETRSYGAAERKIGEIENRLSSGEDFAVLAGEYSEGPEASTGGDLGFVPAAELRREIESAVSGLSPGEVSSVVRTEEGFNIFKLAGVKEGRRMEFEEVKDALLRHLFQKQMEREARNLLERLKSDSYIEVRI